ncbi:hypothetical protein EMCRGX_G023821 [Ephydatia muelleri]
MPSFSEEGFQIQCFTCGNWYTSSDVQVSLDAYIPYMTNYEYTCSSCGVESISKKPASFIQVGITTIANLTAQHAGSDPPRVFFSLEDEIIPFIWDQWDIICTKRSKASTWKNNIATKLSMETRIFCESSEGSQEFGLVDLDLLTIGPRRYESKSVPSKTTTKPKRKFEGGQLTSAPKKARGDGSNTMKGLQKGYPLEHPYNKESYRYILAEKDPHSTLEWDPEEMAGRPIPPELYRPLLSNEVLLALHDRAPQLKIHENRLSVTGDKGYCMVRATHGVSAGTWYYEVHIDDLITVPDATVRLGWAQPLGNLQAPCGYDKLSYSWRSKFGTIFHQSRGKHYSDGGGYGTGDTVGFLIKLPQSNERRYPPTHKDEALIRFKNFFYFEEKDDPVDEYEKALKPASGSKIIFYKNGVSQGVAFNDLGSGTYYPALSFYKAGTVTVNFGPEFKHPPTDIEFRPMSEAAEVTIIHQAISEMLFHVESILASRKSVQYPAHYPQDLMD